MDFPVSGRGRLLKGCHHYVDEPGVPIRRLPEDRIQNRRDAKHEEALYPDKEEDGPEQPNYGIHDRQTEQLRRAHEAKEQG